MKLQLLSKITPRLWIGLLVGIIAGIQLSPWISMDKLDFIATGHARDDAFFYSVLANNYLKYNFVTFDGVNSTNGYQPLWFYILLFLKSLIPQVDAFYLLRVMSWLSYVSFVIFSTLTILNTANNKYTAAFILNALLLLNASFQDMIVTGLEPPLLLLLISVFFYYCYIFFQKDKTSVNYIDLLLILFLSVLIFYTRTDLFWISAVLIFSVLILLKDIKFFLFMLISVSIMVIPLLLHNYLNFDSIVPISARAKIYLLNSFLLENNISYWDTDEWHGLFSIFLVILPNAKITAPTIAIVIVIMLYSVYLPWSSFFAASIKRKERSVLIYWRMFSIVILLHTLYLYIFHQELRPYTNYYFAPELFYVVFLVSYLTPAISRIRIIHVILIVLLLNVTYLSNYEEKKGWVDRIAIAKELNKLGVDTVGAWWPGLFSEISNVNIIPLESIISDNDYLENYLKKQKEIDFLKQKEIDYFVSVGKGEDILTRDSPPNVSSWPLYHWKTIWEHRDRLETQITIGDWSIFHLR
jgi:hypothetical protein